MVSHIDIEENVKEIFLLILPKHIINVGLCNLILTIIVHIGGNHIITLNIESVLPLCSRRKDILPRQKRPAYNTLTALLTPNDFMYRTRTADVRFDGCVHDQKRFLIIELKEIIHLTKQQNISFRRSSKATVVFRSLI